ADDLSGRRRADPARRGVGYLPGDRSAELRLRRGGASHYEFSACVGRHPYAIARLRERQLPIRVRQGPAVTSFQPEPRLTRDHLEHLFTKMAARCVVVVGDAMLDIYLAGDAERISPEAPVPVVTVPPRRDRPDGAANGAEHAPA